jgi:TPR repeat protein
MRYLLILTALLTFQSVNASGFDFDKIKLQAEQGDEIAQYLLGRMYYLGEGVPESSVHAYAWFSLAKTQGQADAASSPDILKPRIAKQQARAADSLEILKPRMTKQQIAQGQALATQCYESDYKDCD